MCTSRLSVSNTTNPLSLEHIWPRPRPAVAREHAFNNLPIIATRSTISQRRSLQKTPGRSGAQPARLRPRPRPLQLSLASPRRVHALPPHPPVPLLALFPPISPSHPPLKTLASSAETSAVLMATRPRLQVSPRSAHGAGRTASSRLLSRSGARRAGRGVQHHTRCAREAVSPNAGPLWDLARREGQWMRRTRRDTDSSGRWGGRVRCRCFIFVSFLRFSFSSRAAAYDRGVSRVGVCTTIVPSLWYVSYLLLPSRLHQFRLLRHPRANCA